jgi:nucleotide-binding universal stress UspA family protein
MAHVVAAVDGSAPSGRAVDWAVDEAARRGVALRLVHASVLDRFETGDGDEDNLAQIHRAVDLMLADSAARAASRRPGVPVTTAVAPEETVPALLREGGLADVLVLGSRGHGGFEGLLLGSVSLRVVGRADFPVVVVRGTGEVADSHGRVVLGAGSHGVPGAAARFALAQAVARKAELDIVHAWQPDLDWSGLSVVMDTGPALERAQTLLAAVAVPLEEEAGVRVNRQAVPGGAASALLRAAAEADLLVVGASRRHLQLGSVAHAVLHHAPCPVAVVPET